MLVDGEGIDFSIVTTQVPKTIIGGLHHAGTTRDMGGTVTKPGI